MTACSSIPSFYLQRTRSGPSPAGSGEARPSGLETPPTRSRFLRPLNMRHYLIGCLVLSHRALAVLTVRATSRLVPLHVSSMQMALGASGCVQLVQSLPTRYSYCVIPRIDIRAIHSGGDDNRSTLAIHFGWIYSRLCPFPPVHHQFSALRHRPWTRRHWTDFPLCPYTYLLVQRSSAK